MVPIKVTLAKVRWMLTDDYKNARSWTNQRYIWYKNKLKFGRNQYIAIKNNFENDLSIQLSCSLQDNEGNELQKGIIENYGSLYYIHLNRFFSTIKNEEDDCSLNLRINDKVNGNLILFSTDDPTNPDIRCPEPPLDPKYYSIPEDPTKLSIELIRNLADYIPLVLVNNIEEEKFRDLILHNPNKIINWLQLGIVYYRNRCYDAAHKCFEKTNYLSRKKIPESWHLLGLCKKYLLKGNAVSCFSYSAKLYLKQGKKELTHKIESYLRKILNQDKQPDGIIV